MLARIKHFLAAQLCFVSVFFQTMLCETYNFQSFFAHEVFLSFLLLIYEKQVAFEHWSHSLEVLIKHRGAFYVLDVFQFRDESLLAQRLPQFVQLLKR